MKFTTRLTEVIFGFNRKLYDPGKKFKTYPQCN